MNDKPDLDALEAQHEHVIGPTGDECSRCDAPWPCPVALLICEVRRLAGEREDAEADERGNAPDLDALQKLCDAATPGPWGQWPKEGMGMIVLGCTGGIAQTDEGNTASIGECWANAAFIAAARTALPALITEVRRLRKLVGE